MPLERDDSMQRRLAWRCRRGMLELDIVLQKFVNEQFFSLSQAELVELDQLLDLPDNDFWSLITGATALNENTESKESTKSKENIALQSLLSKIRAQ